MRFKLIFYAIGYSLFKIEKLQTTQNIIYNMLQNIIIYNLLKLL